MTLEQRVRKLERENRWMRRIAGVAVACVAVVVLVAQGKEKKLPDLEVRSLVVKDDAGTRRVVIEEAGIAVVDKKGKVRASLTTRTGGSALVLSDKDGKTRVRLRTFMQAPDARDNLSELRLSDENGKDRARLMVSEGGIMSALMVNDANGTEQASVSAMHYGMPRFVCYDRKGRGRATLGAHANGESYLVFKDQNKNMRVWFYTTEKGTRLKLSDERGKVRATLSMKDGTPSLTVFDAEGKVIWQAPR